jgi:hypothetical protein
MGDAMKMLRKKSLGPGVFTKMKYIWKNSKICQQTKIRILEATAITVIENGSEMWALRKTKKDLLDFFQKNY